MWLFCSKRSQKEFSYGKNVLTPHGLMLRSIPRACCCSFSKPRTGFFVETASRTEIRGLRWKWFFVVTTPVLCFQLLCLIVKSAWLSPTFGWKSRHLKKNDASQHSKDLLLQFWQTKNHFFYETALRIEIWSFRGKWFIVITPVLCFQLFYAW